MSVQETLENDLTGIVQGVYIIWTLDVPSRVFDQW